ncbi:hypothetical protein [Nocardia sp. NPDC003963]
MSRRETPWTSKDTWQCIGMIPLTGGALLACTDNLSIDDMRAYAHNVGELAVPIAAGVGGALLLVAVALVTVSYLRLALLAAIRVYWLYRRRWSAVLEDLGLTETEGDHLVVPRLIAVTRQGNEDIMTVRMLPGQSAQDWHERSGALAADFGAASARVSFGVRPHREVVLTFDRTPAPKRPLLELEAPKPHPIPLSLEPWSAQPKPEPRVAISLTGFQLRIAWARVQRLSENDRGVLRRNRARYGLRGDMRWATWAAVT